MLSIKDKPSIDYILQFFNVSTLKYDTIKINNYFVLKKKYLAHK